ncbi:MULTISPECIES: hypothetical protein [unclassified Marinobacter]|uniref:hypothetical protein n=1 Tax=unclassified Marinobacter TaxID=83889 RepID=UPI00192810AB|nr:MULTISPECIES: hypothetical protein [unclassified Marinobacter]MBL3826536.1 hypothetical protein [Marinobacter sp. MC3]MBL3894947.1 hypothetical protein [Marinobacter sp. MW3]
MRKSNWHRSAGIAAKAAGLAMLACGQSVAWAEPTNPALTQRHEFILGIYEQSADIAVAAALRGRPLGGISLDDLGVDDTYVSGLFGYRWRFTPRWTLVANAYINRVSGERVVNETFEYDGETYEAGASLNSQFSADIYMLDVMYSVLQTDRFELQLGGGLHAFELGVSFDATVTLNDDSLRVTSSKNDLLAPLPNLRMQILYALSDRWTAYFNSGWLSLNVDDYDGRYRFASVSTDYRFANRFGIGVGYQYTSMDVKHQSDNTRESYDVQYDGPTLYITYGF